MMCARSQAALSMKFSLFFKQLQQRSGPGFGAGKAGFARLMERLGNPQNQYRIIHVAGTNGKGSVCYLCAASLQKAGWRSGLFVSPHLFFLQERIQINGKPISAQMLVQLCQEVVAQEQEPLNFFEIITAVALLYFAREQVQYAVLETGLGGRKDPTNIVKPQVCVITSIGLDHCAVLGGTLKKIAHEKAGIIKPGVPVFCPPLPASAWAEIRRRSDTAGARLRQVKTGSPFKLQKIDWGHGRLLLQKGKERWPLAILGEKQISNACLVYQVCRFLGVPESALKKAFAHINVPCRFEVMRLGKKTFIFDGAHNPQAVTAFTSFFKRSPWSQNAALVCGFMKDKDYPQMIKTLAAYFAALYITTPGGVRAVPVGDLAAALSNEKGLQRRRSGLNRAKAVAAKTAKNEVLDCQKAVLPAGGGPFVFSFSSAEKAFRAAAAAYDTVAVCGSFYLAGRLRARKGLTAFSDCD